MKEIESAFNARFAHWGITLPPEDIAQRRRGKIVKAGWAIWYLFGSDEKGEYLDYYASHRMTNDRHVRIWEDGQQRAMESYWQMLVYDADVPGDKERAEDEYREHNRRVSEVLKRKGFH